MADSSHIDPLTGVHRLDKDLSLVDASGNALLVESVYIAGSAVSGSVVLAAGSAIIGKVGIDQTTPGTTNKVAIGTDGTVTLAAGSALVGKVSIDQTTPGTTNAVAATGPAASGASNSGNPVKIGAVFNTTPPTVTNGQTVDVQATARGILMVNIAGTSGNVVGVVNSAAGRTAASGIVVESQGDIWNGATFDPVRKPNTVSHIASSGASTNATVLKASAGDLYTIAGFSARASICYLHIYNKATTPSVGTDVPVLTLPIPVNSVAPFSFQFQGLYFATGISYGFSTGSADNDSAAIAAGDILGFNMTGA